MFIAATFVLVWMAWMALARASIRETSVAARIEIARRTRPVESAADGVVAAIDVQPGARSPLPEEDLAHHYERNEGEKSIIPL